MLLAWGVITGVAFKHFRQFDQLEVGPLGRVTLLAGTNNSGKTGILEGIYLGCMTLERNPQGIPRLFRTQPGPHASPSDELQNYWAWLFENRDMSQVAEITLTQDNAPNIVEQFEGRPAVGGPIWVRVFRTTDVNDLSRPMIRQHPPMLTISGGQFQPTVNNDKVPNVGAMAATPSDPAHIAELFNLASIQAGGESAIEDFMRQLMPGVKRLRYLKPPGTFSPLVYCDTGISQLVPSTQMGEGFARVLAIYCQMFVAKLDVLLIDEIENGLHHSAQRSFWRGIFALATSANMQIIATTHSWECVRAAFEISTEEKKESGFFQFLRLDRVNGHTKCTAIGGEGMQVALEQGWEMR